MKIVIDISEWEASRQKEIINSIKGFVKSLSKRIGFRAEFDVELCKSGRGWRK